MWGGLALSYEFATLPPSSAIIGLAGAGYVLAFAPLRRGATRNVRLPSRARRLTASTRPRLRPR